MAEKKSEKENRKRISVQLFPHEEWILEKAHDLAALDRVTLRDVIVRLVKEEAERNKPALAKMEQSRAEKGRIRA